MATRYTPRIVTDGLVLCLDAGNPKSYPGSGTAWTDISRNGKDFTLGSSTASPTYSSNNSGYFTFDGTNDYATTSSWAWPTTTSINLFLYPLGNGATYARVISTGAGDGFEIAVDANRKLSFYTPTNGWNTAIVTLNNNWQLVSLVQAGSTVDIYINASKVYSGILTTTAGSSLYIGGRYSGGENSNVRLSNLTIYNRTLTANEVLQNYNATKSRFGL